MVVLFNHESHYGGICYRMTRTIVVLLKNSTTYMVFVQNGTIYGGTFKAGHALYDIFIEWHALWWYFESMERTMVALFKHDKDYGGETQ